jgi:hypothetical protein
MIGNENADTAAKEALNERVQSTQKHPPKDFTKWIEQKYQRQQQEKWKNTTTEMKERKPHIRSNRETRPMTRKDQVVISWLRTGYCRATHAAIMNPEPRPECPIDDRPHPMAI